MLGSLSILLFVRDNQQVDYGRSRRAKVNNPNRVNVKSPTFPVDETKNMNLEFQKVIINSRLILGVVV